MHDEGLLEPKGFSWLLKNSYYSDNAKSTVLTITAPSHVSTITCTPPSRHGIVGNSFLNHKGEYQSGFSKEFKPEPLWAAAKRQGLTVLSIAYVGSDGSSESRKVDWGIAYPDRKYNSKRQWVEIEKEEVQKVRLILNPQTKESRQVFLYQREEVTYLDQNENFDDGFIAKLEDNQFKKVYFIEKNNTSPLFGYK